MEHGNETSRFMNAILYMSMYVKEEILVIIRKITLVVNVITIMTHLTTYLTHLTTILIVIISIYSYRMPSKLPDNLKSLVIQQWLAGIQRDKIAVDNGLSAGAVQIPSTNGDQP